MSAVNPFTPPRATVSDVHPTVSTFSTPKVWSAKGRIGRLRYLAYTSVGSLVCMLIGGVAAFLGTLAQLGPDALTGLVLIAAYVPMTVLFILSLIQRSHDMDWSGWTCLLAFIPLAAFLWIFKAGSPGENRFGAPPPANSTGVKIGASLVIVFMLVGIVAAIALPAYQGYVMRAQAAQLSHP